jgi:hypothetical protein
MQNFDDNIDLDALFDSLNIAAAPSDTASNAAMTLPASKPDVKEVEIQDISSLEGDLFLFDTPSDQS